MIHIQKTAPGPPIKIAVAVPAILPVPIRPPTVVANAWNGDSALSCLLSPFSSRHFAISFTLRTCIPFNRTVNHTAAIIRNTHITGCHTMSFTVFITFTNNSIFSTPFIPFLSFVFIIHPNTERTLFQL